jgi:hypothetical protein
MIISLINHTNLPDVDVQQAIRAVNVQIEQDFYPYWSIGATLRLEGRIGEDPDLDNLAASLRGDAILYLEDTIDKDDPLGFHNLHFSGIPFGFAFTEISRQMGEPWQVTLSHEALELIADAEVNRLIMGPHPNPEQKGRMVFHWYEMCDAVQAERYDIQGVPVSNFVLPLYFTVDSERGSRNDFLATTRSDGSRLPSFGLNPGGYIGFYDPELDDHDTYFADAVARRRAEIKSQLGFARRGIRYKSQVTKPLPSGRVPGSRVKAVPLIKSETGRAKAARRKSKPAVKRQASKPAAKRETAKTAAK